MTISFGGASIKRPGAYSTVDTSSMTPVTVGAFNVLAFVGVPNSSNTLTMGVVSYFNDPAVAAAAVGDSELLAHMKTAWAHGADLIAVSPVAPSAADTDWQTAVDVLQTEFVDGIVPVTTTAALISKVDAHITLMSSVTNRRERRGFYGHATGLAVTAITALTTSLPTERGMMFSPGVYTYDSTGAKVLKPSSYAAAAAAGIWASQPPQEPITYKYLKFPGIEKIFLSTEVDSLLTAHIVPVEYVRNKGYRIVQGITLSNSTDLTKVELSVSTLKDVMSRNIREYFEDKYVGHAGVAGVEVTMKNDLISLIEKFKEAGWIAGYVAESVRVMKNGTAYTLDWEGTPTLPINNFLLTTHAKLG